MDNPQHSLVLARHQMEELQRICSESALSGIPWGNHAGSNYAFVRSAKPQVAAHLYRLGLLARDRRGERETVGGHWNYFWAYKPTAEGKAAGARQAADQ